ncbi:nucleotidyltransferase family protein [uncultured Bartonella sp.]|uniref:nucleotidyltransferase family protein n=1 Tax=uncultured Bartonella sp. TaxID=104108 RepID=UPI0025EA3763|nr:nucleotidyltransferase family protein [uncultured Bartonella sp.]
MKLTHAMVLAAGLGTRMRPLTFKTPKPLVKIAGRSLLNRALDALEKVGVEEAVVNVHYLADSIESHVESRKKPHVTISDERAELLDSAGGVVKALSLLGDNPFFVLNADTFWVDHGEPTLQAMADVFDPEKMDMLLMTVKRQQAAGPERGDFLVGEGQKLIRAPLNSTEAVIYGGALIARPEIFSLAKIEPQSLNLYFDQAISKSRLYGFPLDGNWYTVGTIEMIGKVEELMRKRGEIA